jgi:hypothetical protein
MSWDGKEGSIPKMVWDFDAESEPAMDIVRHSEDQWRRYVASFYDLLVFRIAEVRYAFGPGSADAEEEILDLLRPYLGYAKDDDSAGMEGG